MADKTNSDGASQKSGMKPNYWRRSDSVQIYEGYYHLLQNSEIVGKLLVKPGTSTDDKTEHWGLYATYRWPSDRNTRESLTFDYQGPHGTLGVTEFKSSLPSGTIYVVASCHQEVL